MDATQDSPRIADVEHALGEWIASILPGIDIALAEIGDGDWKPGTREAVLRRASHAMVEQFEAGRWPDVDTIDELNEEARDHLGRYVLARARAHVKVAARSVPELG